MSKRKIFLHNDIALDAGEVAFMQLKDTKVILLFKGNSKEMHISFENDTDAQEFAMKLYEKLQ